MRFHIAIDVWVAGILAICFPHWAFQILMVLLGLHALSLVIATLYKLLSKKGNRT